MDSATYFFRRAAAHLDGPAVDADLVRQDQPIVAGALCLGHAVVKAQEHRRMADASLPQCSPVCPFLDHDLDVVQFLPEGPGQRVEGLGDEPFECLYVHITLL